MPRRRFAATRRLLFVGLEVASILREIERLRLEALPIAGRVQHPVTGARFRGRVSSRLARLVTYAAVRIVGLADLLEGGALREVERLQLERIITAGRWARAAARHGLAHVVGSLHLPAPDAIYDLGVAMLIAQDDDGPARLAA